MVLKNLQNYISHIHKRTVNKIPVNKCLLGYWWMMNLVIAYFEAHLTMQIIADYEETGRDLTQSYDKSP